MALVAFRDRDDEPQVRVRHPLLRRLVALLDPLRERDLFGGGQERVPSDLVQEELQAVGAAAGRRAQVETGLRWSGSWSPRSRRRRRRAQPATPRRRPRRDRARAAAARVCRAHAAALLRLVQEGGEGWNEFEGVSAQFMRTQQILQGVLSKPTLEVSARQNGPPEASLPISTLILTRTFPETANSTHNPYVFSKPLCVVSSPVGAGRQETARVPCHGRRRGTP